MFETQVEKIKDQNTFHFR